MNLFRVLLTAIAFISKTSESQSYFECRSNTNSSLGYLDTFVKCDLDGSQSCFQLAIPSNKERSGIRLYGCISDSELPDEFSEKKADKGLYRTRFQMTLEEKKYIGAVKLCAVHRCNELDFVMVEPLKQRMSSFLTRYLGIVYPFLIPLALFFVSGYPGIVSYRRNKRLRRDEFGDTGKPLDTLLFPGSTFETSTEEIVTTRVPCRVVNLFQVQTLIQKLRFSTTLPQWNQEIQKNNAKDWIQKTVTINPTITTYEQDHIGYVKPIRRQPSKCEKLLHRLLEHGPGLFPFNAAELGDLFNEATDVFASEPSLITVPPGVVIYGDIRGQYTDLYRWFYINGFPPSRRKQVFLGGIVSDGNDFSLETLALLAALKVALPYDIFIIRGAPEALTFNLIHRFPRKICRALTAVVARMFSFMPLAVNVGGKILCVHGGPSPLLEEIEDIEQIPRPLTEYDNKRMSSHLLFSEATPDVEKNAFETKKYGRGLTFGPTAVEDTCKKLNISLIIRSHNSIPGGYFMQSEGKLLSIFSAPGDPGCVKGACAVVENDFSVKIVRLAVHGQLRAPTVGDSLQTVEKKVEIYIDDPSMAETTLEKNTSTIEKVVSLEKTVGKTVE